MANVGELGKEIIKLDNFKGHKFTPKLIEGLREFNISKGSGGSRTNTNIHLFPKGSGENCDLICHIKGESDKLTIKKSNLLEVNGDNYRKLLDCLEKTKKFEHISKLKIKNNLEKIKFEIKTEKELEIFIDAVRNIEGLKPMYTKEENIEEIKKNAFNALKIKEQLILSGPPGTGKTRLAKILALKLINNELNEEEDFDMSNEKLEGDFEDSIREGRVKIVQFHPSYDYNEFVIGLEAKTKNNNLIYKVKEKGIKEFADSIKKGNEKKYVLIIDEINRAPLSSVLGELLYALEYRDEEINIHYNEKLTIPQNLYIIGTMNTADRSIGDIDYTIRRRFSFIDIPPMKIKIKEEGKYAFEEKLFDRINEIFDESKNISKEIKSDDVRIGTSYFLYNKEDKKHIEYKVKYEIMPILKEYYNDGILNRRGECGKGKNYKFEEIFRDKNREKEFINYLLYGESGNVDE